jgi:DNA-binding transcriptional LysR family regulator
MELRELKSFVAAVDCGLNVSQAAERLHLVQSAVSQHLARLETELGTRLFVRQGKRLAALTPAGARVLDYARQALAIREDILTVGRDHVDEATGVLRIGTTHTQARYVLPPVIRAFRHTYPHVALQIHQGTPPQLAELAAADTVDFAICTEALAAHPALTTLPCYRWNRSLIAPLGHPVLDRQPLSLELFCEYPLITYVFGFTGSSRLRSTFARMALEPDVVLSAADTDVIKTYVREGLGVGLIATVAYSARTDSDLAARDLSHLFPWETTFIAYRRDKYLRRFQQHFIELLQRMVQSQGVEGGE